MPVNTRSQSALQERYRCPICQDLLIEPVSVNCGHTFCRLCLAKWTLQCKMTKCAQCTRFWNGQPQVNIVLREVIQETFPAAYEEREELHAEERDIVVRFDNEIQAMVQRDRLRLQQTRQAVQAAAQNNNNNGFLIGLLLAVVFGLLAYLLGFGQTDTYVTKPVETWTLMDCIQWMESLGDWTKASVLPILASHQLDGKLLLELARNVSLDNAQCDVSDTSDFEMPDLNWPKEKSTAMELNNILDGESEENVALFYKALQIIHTEGRVPPGDLWEYQAAHPLKSLVLLELAFSFPRTSALMMFVFDYRGSFLPLIHCVTGNRSISIYDTELPAPTTSQYLDFMWRLVLMPLITIYTKFLLVALWSTNFWAMLYTCLRTCVAVTYDFSTVYAVLQNEALRTDLMKTLRGAFYTGCITYTVGYVVSFILPSALTRIICSCFFYINFLALPLKDVILCIPILYGFIKYLRANSRDVIWQDFKTLAGACGPALKSLGEYLTVQFPAECKALLDKVYFGISTIAQGLFHYLQNHALQDVWALLKVIHRITLRICVTMHNYAFGAPPQHAE